MFLREDENAYGFEDKETVIGLEEVVGFGHWEHQSVCSYNYL
jgi:hypothetical protein